MQGHGHPQPAQPPPPTGALVLVRVLLVGLSVFSIGFLAWTMLLRLAIVTRKSLDWGLLVAALAADVLSIVLLGSEPGDDVHTGGGYLGLTLLLGTLVASIVYYLAAEIRHYQQLRQDGYGGRPPAAYGYPQPGRPPAPYMGTTVPQHTPPPMPHTPVPQPHTPPPMPHAPVPQPPHTPPPGQRPTPARIDQVRAELDELSDYLRKHDEGGR